MPKGVLFVCAALVGFSPARFGRAAGTVGAQEAGLAEGATETMIKDLVHQMSLEEKIGQMLMIEQWRDLDETRKAIVEYHIGGELLDGSSITDPVQAAAFTNRLQEMAQHTRLRVPLLFSANLETGLGYILSAATTFPTNMGFGAARSGDLVYAAAQITAEEARAIGIHMSLAPVMDVNNNPKNPVIGVRSFGESPELVSELGVQAIRGLQENGMIATAKHFPGHGDTGVDSHIDLPTVPHNWQRLERVELKPFRAAISAGVKAIMTSHVTFPAIDPMPGLPATLSRRVLTDLLRKKLGFNGIIITDSMVMNAIVKNFGLEEAAVRAVQAGADIVLAAYSFDEVEKVSRALVTAVKSGEIPEAQIDASVERILAAKAEVGLFKDPFVAVEKVGSIVGSLEHRQKAKLIAKQAVTLLRDDVGLLPLRLEPTDRLLLISASPDDTFITALRRYRLQASEFKVGRNPDPEQLERALELARTNEVIIVATYATGELPVTQRRLVAEVVKLGRPVVVVSLGTPYDVAWLPEARTVLAAYAAGPWVVLKPPIEAAVDYLFGRAQAGRGLPVTIPAQ
ncbi:MAG: glycoside hydrolase family 3 protein [Firmicutes bacterium]|nr:glycoside hydrolase family 3 protein [Bacillota bacterium]